MSASVIDKYDDNQPEEEYIMMRKFGLILLKDIVHGNDSLITQEFEKYMKPGDKDRIRKAFSAQAPIIDNDINISLDQTRRLRAAIAADSTFAYPLPEADGTFSIDKACIYNNKTYKSTYRAIVSVDEDLRIKYSRLERVY